MGQYESITDHDKEVVKAHWTVIGADLANYGSAFFTCLFTDYHLMANYFPFVGPGDEKFQLHAQKFMHQLDLWVSILENPNKLRKSLSTLGIRHAKRNIEPEQFLRMRQSFIKAAGAKIGPRHFDDDAQTVFDKLLTLAMNDIIDAGDAERKKRGVDLF